MTSMPHIPHLFHDHRQKRNRKHHSGSSGNNPQPNRQSSCSSSSSTHVSSVSSSVPPPPYSHQDPHPPSPKSASSSRASSIKGKLGRTKDALKYTLILLKARPSHSDISSLSSRSSRSSVSSASVSISAPIPITPRAFPPLYDEAEHLDAPLRSGFYAAPDPSLLASVALPLPARRVRVVDDWTAEEERRRKRWGRVYTGDLEWEWEWEKGEWEGAPPAYPH